MAKSRRQRVIERAGGRCEYCQMPRQSDVLPFQLDHILAQKHDDPTTLANLAYACLPCNAYKGPNIAGIDPETGQLVPLFNPRTNVWHEHFRWDGPTLIGLSPVARATIAVLRINLGRTRRAPPTADASGYILNRGIQQRSVRLVQTIDSGFRAGPAHSRRNPAK